MAFFFRAYVDNKETIVIESEDSYDSFKINDETIFALQVQTQGNIYKFIAKYPLEYGKEYILTDHLNNKCIVNYRLVCKENCFDNEFFYEGNDLGSTYNPTYTIFKTWAPLASKVKLKYFFNGLWNIVEMKREDKGIFSIIISGDLQDCLYNYLVTNNGVEVEVQDIYAFSGNANFMQSSVINLNRLTPINYNPSLFKVYKNNDCIIYETSIRDFTSLINAKNKSTFKAFINQELKSLNNNPIGFEYLINLGITHIQLMPITDFSTTDDLNYKNTYNWGYDPRAFNILKGAYSTNPNDPYARMNEFIELVNACHKHNLRVCVDMVFNHTYSKDSIYNKLVPNYFYLLDENGNYSNGSFCGNDLDCNRKMVKKYIVDMSTRLVSLYHIDGIRLDLMGILTIDTVNEIYNQCKKINPDFILYGEGWNMPSLLRNEEKATILNHSSLPNIAFFNDSFRDTMRGKSTPFEAKGYINGNSYNTYHAIRAMRGCIETGCYFGSTLQSINYIDCHDNMLLVDKLNFSNPTDSIEIKNKIILLSLAAIAFSLGIPFFHSGMEFNRSKKNVDNSYNKDDTINGIDWTLVDKYPQNIKAFKDFLNIRKEFPCFHLFDKKTILNCVDGLIVDDKIMSLTYAYNGNVLVLIFNPNNYKTNIDLDDEYHLYANEYGKVNSDLTFSKITIKPFSFNLLIK